MNSLFVCHSTDDTTALIASAEALLNKNSQCKPIFLLIGAVAEEQWDALPLDSILQQSSTVQRLPKAFLKKFAQASEKATVTYQHFELFKVAVLKHLLETYTITNVLIGTPSENQSSLVLQIAEYIAQYFKDKDKNAHLFVYHDYLFEEKAHGYWQVMNNNEEHWAENIDGLVPLPTAKAKVMEAFSIDKNKVHPLLSVRDKKSLLFISGNKDFSKDKALLEALFQALEKNPDPELELRLGTHPYLSPNRILAGKDKLSLFFSTLKKKKSPQPMNKSELGLNEKTFLQVMSDKLLRSDAFIPESVSLTPQLT